ncbi:hypothetical protein SAMN05421734_11249 [Pelagirhabdus alkalitolerans]|uniref:PDZ domain-containing protein n=1 Tax=Pelagirhabdus alkalitolerans TaxID=1612202 RepID=A0A1G6MT98_9BACI|nr:PDZ domain-containing protein [Pelagirhabdus alkalitolerans]SDC58818.1 hypothetical protein SAMN05421734_11249 [Pelagirhabdus alkalitolerans]
MELWLVEIAKAFMRFLANPLLYWFLIIALLASTSRIKYERRQFGQKIFPILDEVYGYRRKSMVFGLILSLLLLLLGVVLEPLMLIGLVIVTILLSISRRFTWLSTAYTFGITAIILLFLPLYESWLPTFLQVEISTLSWVSFTVIMGLFLIFEAFISGRIIQDQTFPELFKSPRGKTIGQHRFKKIMIIPTLMIWPIGGLELNIDWWPVLEWQGEQFGLIIFPFIIGIEHVFKSALPQKMMKRMSHYLLLLGLVVVAISLVGYFVEIAVIMGVAVALIGREWITYRFRRQDSQGEPFFNPINNGIKVLAVLPESPAVDMGLGVGDRITKVNGLAVSGVNDFYQALQENRAFCKLDVLDERGEVRFVQRALYQNEHHELGVIFSVSHDERVG